MTYQVEQHQIKPSSSEWDYCVKVCSASKNLYNSAQYSNRQSFIYGHGTLSQSQLDKLFNSDLNYKDLPAKVSQLVLKQVADAWISFFKALESWKEDPKTFTGKPKKPGYIENKYNLVKFNNQAISKTEFKKGFIVPSMSPICLPVKPGLRFEDLVEVRLVPNVGCFVVEIVYDDGFTPWNLGYNGLAAAIDIGVDNLATITFSDPTVQPIAINGKPLKSENQWFNKEVARLRSQLPQGFGTSHRINNVTRNRNNFVHDYLHKSTKRIVDELDDIGVTHVAIGKNPQWKTEVKLGGKNNQNFVQIPHAKFVSMLTQKLEKLGITVKVGEESYTSKASFLDWDEIPTWQPGKPNEVKFSGRRVKTKKYQSKDGIEIHADVNGSFNIGRKVFPNFFSLILEKLNRDSGCVVAHPRRVNPLKMTNLKNILSQDICPSF